MHYHKAIGRKAGLSDAQIKELDAYEQSSAYSDVEKAVLRFAEQWTRQPKVAPEVVKKLAQTLTPAALVTLAATVALANWTNRFNETFATELP
jgi:alkylhydroperoxidase family enzyme